MSKTKTVLKGTAWHQHLVDNELSKKKQEEMYVATHNYTAIYKLAGYYFCFEITRGYTNLSSLKRLM